MNMLRDPLPVPLSSLQPWLLLVFVHVQIKCSFCVAAFLVLLAPDLVRDRGWFAGLSL